MRTMVLAIILAFSASIVPALGGHGSKSSNAFIARVGLPMFTTIERTNQLAI